MGEISEFSRCLLNWHAKTRSALIQKAQMWTGYRIGGGVRTWSPSNPITLTLRGANRRLGAKKQPMQLLWGEEGDKCLWRAVSPRAVKGLARFHVLIFDLILLCNCRLRRNKITPLSSEWVRLLPHSSTGNTNTNSHPAALTLVSYLAPTQHSALPENIIFLLHELKQFLI